MKRYMYELKEMLCNDLEGLTAKGELSVSDIELVHNLTGSLKNIYKIEMFSEGERERSYMDYSGRHYEKEEDQTDVKVELMKKLNSGIITPGERNAITKLLEFM